VIQETTEPASERHFALIECNEAPASGVFWLMALVLPSLGFLVLWVAGVPLRFDVPAREFNPLVLLPIIASLAGLFFLVGAIFMTLRLRRYGRSMLSLNKRPKIGGRVTGRITSTVDVAPSGDWELILQCIETITNAGANNRIYSTDLTRWKYQQTLPAPSYSLRSGIPVEIAIPDNCLELTDPVEIARSARGQLRWVLQLHNQGPGLNYAASFLIPIRSAER